MKLVMVIGFVLSIVVFSVSTVNADVALPSGLSPNAGLSVQNLTGASQPSNLPNQGVLNIASFLLQGPLAAEDDQGELDNNTILLSAALLVLVFVFGLVLLLKE